MIPLMWVVRIIETESKFMVARGGADGKMGSYCLRVECFSLQDEKSYGGV